MASTNSITKESSKKPAVDLSGLRFGRLTVIRVVGQAADTRWEWECRCDCGRTTKTVRHRLFSGHTQSCGCLFHEARSQSLGVFRKHGLSRTVEYATWNSMIQRCYNTANAYYSRYGGRGIRVCKRWLKFENFLVDMGQRPSTRYSIDRIDNNGNYEPKNCRWATQREQQSNTCRSVRLTYNGITRCRAEWERVVGLGRGSLASRLKRGWDIERALITPAR